MKLSKFLLVFCFTLFSGVSQASESISGVDYLYAKLILQGEYELAAKGMDDDDVLNIELWDMIAEKLPKAVLVKDRKYDAHGEIAGMLALSGLRRYREAYIDSIADLKKSPFSKKKKRFIKRFSKGDHPSFSKGSVDIEAVKAKLEDTYKKRMPKETFGYFSDAKSCTPVESILENYGYPKFVDVEQTYGSKLPMVGRLKLRQIVLIYPELGEVMLTRKVGVKGWCLMRTLPSPALMGYADVLDDKGKKVISQLRKGLWTWSRTSLRNTRYIIRDNPTYAQAIHDEIVLRVWWGRFETEDFTEDSLAILLKYIKRAPSSRYREAMTLISNESTSRKIRTHSWYYLNKITGPEEDQFIPHVEHMYLSVPK